jgi:amidase
MRTVLAILLVLFVPIPSIAQDGESWLVTVDRWGNPERQLMTLERGGDSLAGRLGRSPLAGRISGDSITFAATDGRGAVHAYRGTLSDGEMRGVADFPDTNDGDARALHAFSARRLPARSGAPRRIAFDPVSFSNEFTAQREPVLVIWPGDTLATRTLDSGGVDADGRTRALYGNPQTGPFFVAGAQPGDVLAIHLHRLRPNRDEAESLDGIAGRAMGPALAARAAGLGRRVRWRLDRARGVARLADPPEALRDFTVPIRPMLGGLGVAPDFGFAPASAGDSGRFGGNMDYNEIVEGTTVYLPVLQPGALLYLGDGHAAQGDGETTQWALETSLDVELSVELLPARPLAAPRVESATHVAVVGQAGSLDDAVRVATGALAQWLEQDYALTLAEASLVIGGLVEYEIVTLAGRNAGVAARVEKARLAGLPRRVPAPAR